MPLTGTVKIDATGKSLTLAEIRSFVAEAAARRLDDATPVTGQSTLRQGLKWISAEGVPAELGAGGATPLTLSLAGDKQDVCQALQVLGLMFNLTIAAGDLRPDGVYTATVTLVEPHQQLTAAASVAAAFRNGAK